SKHGFTPLQDRLTRLDQRGNTRPMSAPSKELPSTPGRGMPSDEAMGRRLREERLGRGLSQTEVADALGVSPAYLSLIETGKRPMQLPLLLRALEHLEVPVEAFM